MVTEMEDALDTLSSMSMLIPKLVRGKVNEKRERIQALIAEYKEAKKASEPKVKRYTTLKECLRDLLLEEDDELNIYSFTDVKNWPQVDAGGKFGIEPYKEELDLENVSFISLTDSGMVMLAGGDWQEPMEVELSLVDGQLEVIRSGMCKKWKEGMNEEDFIELLKA